MLSKAKMVKARKAVERLYSGTCTIVEYQEVKRANKSTAFEEVVVVENQPCRLSYSTIDSTSGTETGASSVVKSTKLYISPDIKVKAGSKIIVTQNDVTEVYKNSGEPAYYTTHQEVVLDFFKGWS